ncbi:hypothetical protein N9917_04665, partial [Deltaproteobacteria bacterium]|nr:hypothetical protein [Deltaproteobacteria bacterium]
GFDTDTKIAFTSPDAIRVTAGGISMIYIVEDNTQDQVLINEQSYDVDFRVKTTIGDSLLVRGSDGRVGIGTVNPATELEIIGSATATTFLGDLNGTINTATTGTTQSPLDNSTKIATTAYVDTAVSVENIFDRTVDSITPNAANGDIVKNTTGTLGLTGTPWDKAYLSAIENTGGALPITIGTGAGDDFSINTSGFVYEGDTGRLGIGTTTPAFDIHAYDNNGSVEIVAENANSSGSSQVAVRNDLGNQLTIGKLGSALNIPDYGIGSGAIINRGGNLNIASDGNDPIIFYTDETDAMDFMATEKMRISANGNLGIGTTNPNVKLHVAKSGGGIADGGETAILQNITNTTDDTILTMMSGNAGVSRINLGDTDDRDEGFLEYDHSINLFTIGSNGTNKNLNIDSVGNVGIGRTNPTYALEVSTAGSRIQITDPTDSNNVRAGLGNSSGNGGFLELDDASTVSNVLLRSYGDSYLNGGNVGIGETTPDVKLHVVSNTTAYTALLQGAIADDATVGLGFSGYLPGTAAKSVIFHQRNNVASDNTYGRGSLLFALNADADDSDATVADTKMAITNAGNVGINTDTPLSSLDVLSMVNGQGIFTMRDSTSSGDYASFLFGVSDHSNIGYNKGGIFFKRTGLNGVGDFIFANNPLPSLGVVTPSDAAITIKSNGNVGIGVTAPLTKLSVSDADSTIPALGAIGGHFSVLTASGRGLLTGNLNTGDHFMQVQRIDGTALAYDMLLQPTGGNVGIGTVSPSNKLEVNSGTGNRIAVFESEDSEGFISFLDSSTSGADYVGIGAIGDELAFRANNGYRMRIDSSGNVGIGISIPTSKLDISESNDASNVNLLTLSNPFQTVGTETSIRFAPSSAPASRYSAISGIEEGGNNIALKFTTGRAATITEKMRLTSVGYLGIGTDVPVSPLHISEETEDILLLQNTSGVDGEYAGIHFKTTARRFME